MLLMIGHLYQFGDLSTQVAGGTSFLRAFAQQSGQTLGAIVLMAGETSKLGAVLTGPIGLALQIAVPLLAAFAGNMLGAASAEKEHAKAANDNADAISELNKLTGVLNRTHEQEVGLALAAGRAELAGAQATREKTKALLEQAIATERVAVSQVQVSGQPGGMAALGAYNAAKRVDQLSAALAAATKKAAAQAEQALASARVGLENQLLQLQGDTAEIRRRELAALDESLRPIQERIYALQDEQAASAAATQAAQEAAQAQAAIENERNGLLQHLYEVTGNTAALRAMQLEALDPSNRALQQQIWAAQAAKELADAWTSIGDTIADEVRRIRGLTDAGGGNSFVALQGQFNAAVAAARAGDQAAAKGLPDLSKSLLDAAAAAATSRQELARIEAQTAAQLEGVYGVIQAATGASSAALAGFGSSSSSTSSDASAWWSTFAAAAGGASANDDDATDEVRGLREDMAVMRRDLTDALAQLAGYQKKTSDTLDRAMRRSGTDALAVTAVAA